MNLKDLGLYNEISDYLNDNNLSEFSLGRVTQEHRERYVVSTGDMEYDAEITGNLRFSAASRVDFPAVGDWVTFTVYDGDQGIIHHVLPRKSVLRRQAVGKFGETQIISTNLDAAFIIQSVDFNFNLNRLQRYLAVCYSSDIEPVLILSKTDLASEADKKNAVNLIETRDKRVKYFMLSNLTHQGLDQIVQFIEKGKTYCVVGSSGVGKSTLINNLLKMDILNTGQISNSTGKGKHVTEHRELFILENGGIIIDTPGMRELGITDDEAGIKTTFQEIFDLSLKCRFSDCQHINEKGCAVIEAINLGLIDKDSLENYWKMVRERERFQTSVAEKRRKDKEFGKMAKEILKEKKKTKF